MAQYMVYASCPIVTHGTSAHAGTQRVIGPFASRRAADDAAARLVDDPLRWASIRVVEDDSDDDSE